MTTVPYPRASVRAVAQRPRRLGLLEACRVAMQSLSANRLRSFLTMLGIIIGVGSVIVMVALGQGSAEANQESIRKLGTNVLTVYPQSLSRGGVSYGQGSQMNLKPADARAIEAGCPSVRALSAEYRGGGRVKFQNQNARTTVYGAEPAFFEIRNLPIVEGRCFKEDDLRRKAKVAVLGDSLRETLFGALDPVGKYLKVNGQNFRIIGVAGKRGGPPWYNLDDQVTIPVTTAMRRVFGVSYINSISIQAVSETALASAEEEIYIAVARSHRRQADEEPDIRIRNQGDVAEAAAEQSGFLTMLLSGIALVSLVVGGIGIMNIMLVSVTERTREIGIRKAVGARRADILSQFLTESVILSLVGGLLGVLGGLGLSLWMGRPAEEGGLGYPMLISTGPIAVSFAFAALVGIFFGIYPAMKAAQLDPIEALRYE